MPGFACRRRMGRARDMRTSWKRENVRAVLYVLSPCFFPSHKWGFSQSVLACNNIYRHRSLRTHIVRRRKGGKSFARGPEREPRVSMGNRETFISGRAPTYCDLVSLLEDPIQKYNVRTLFTEYVETWNVWNRQKRALHGEKEFPSGKDTQKPRRSLSRGLDVRMKSDAYVKIDLWDFEFAVKRTYVARFVTIARAF